MADPSHRVAITVAVIGVVGSLGAALIAKSDKLSALAPQPPGNAGLALGAPSQNAVSAGDSTLQISGNWRDGQYPGTGARLTQDGHALHFTRWGTLPNGVRFESSGSGTFLGNHISSRYVAKYQTGANSTGECWYRFIRSKTH
jgi:hypothetical protein